MLNKREKQFRRAVEDIFSSPSGKLVLKYLREDCVDRSCYSDNPHQAFYFMGQADTVKLLLNALSTADREELETLSVSNFEDIE